MIATPEEKTSLKEAVQITASNLSKNYQFMAIEELDSELYMYDLESKLWRPAKTILRKKLEESHQDFADSRFIQAVLDKLRNNYPIKLNEIPQPPTNLIPLRTAVWDLKKNAPIEYSPDFYFFQKAHVDANPEKTFPTIQAFEKKVFSDNPEKIKKYRKILAYTLVNGYPIKKAFIFYGPSDCGKSKAIELAEKIVGYENSTDISLQDLLQNRFARARLFNKKVNTHADLPPTIVKNPGEFKTLTGGDRIGAEKKGKDGFDFKNTAKFIYSCNQIPEVDPDEVDTVFFGRWEFLDFENRIPVEDQDPEIMEKMVAELDGYCCALLQELPSLLSEKKFSDLSHEQCQEVWMSHSVSAPQFVQECVEPSPGNTVTCSLMVERYLAFCAERHLPAQTSTALGKTLKAAITECYQGYSSQIIEDKHVSMKIWRNVKMRDNPTFVPTMPTISLYLKQNSVMVVRSELKQTASVANSPENTTIDEIPTENVIPRRWLD